MNQKIVQYLFVIVALFAWSVSAAQGSESRDKVVESVKQLTAGVESIPQCGVPGPIMPLGNDSFPVVVGKYQKDVLAPVVAASFSEKGRIVAFGHPSYFTVSVVSQTDDSKRFFNNVIHWCADKNNDSDKKLRIAVFRNKDFVRYLNESGYDAFDFSDPQSDYDVLIADAVALSDKDYDSVFAKVKSGAGFITFGLGWGWSQLNPGKSLIFDHNGNRNFAKHGVELAWTSGTLDAVDGDSYSVSLSQILDTDFIDGYSALELIKKLNDSKTDPQNIVSHYSPAALKQFTSIESLTYPYLKKESKELIDSVVANVVAQEIVPTERRPIKSVDVFERIAVTMQTERDLHAQSVGVTDPESVNAAPAAKDFPGEVPNDAERLNDVVVKVKTAVPDWASTGLYAAPGEVVTVDVDPDLFRRFPKTFSVRIGSHRDQLWHLDSWKRFPEICVEKPLKSPTTKIANPFGGLIYIVVPRGIANAGLGMIDVSISGAVKAPYFIKDVTDLNSWKTIRNYPAPWAEIQGRNIIVTVPSKVVRNLDNPQTLMDAWDSILDIEAEFASIPNYRERPERICCDRQISAGYMHSGYPIMTWMDVEERLVDEKRLRAEGDWGFYHELGHNHQSSNWTFNGSTEVTVNYFTLYVMDKFNGRVAEDANSELSKENQQKKMKRYFAAGAKFEDWAKDPFLALTMTVQLQHEIGWEPFLRTVDEYHKLSQAELPQNDQEKRDQWMVRLSRNSGKNLGSYFEKWGVHTSEEARESVKDLPEWLPEWINEF